MFISLLYLQWFFNIVYSSAAITVTTNQYPNNHIIDNNHDLADIIFHPKRVLSDVGSLISLVLPVQQLYAFEDIPLFIDTLQLICPSCTESEKDIQIIASISASYGQIRVLNTNGVKFSPNSTNTNLTLAGSFYAMTDALNSLVYKPNENWNSNYLGVSDAIEQVLSITFPILPAYQISMWFNSSTAFLNVSSFDVFFGCLLPSNYSKILHSLIITNTTELNLSQSILSLYTQCNSLYRNLTNNSTAETVTLPAIKVTKTAESGIITHISWLIEFTLGGKLQNGMYPDISIDYNKSTSYNISLEKIDYIIPPAQQFQLGFNDQWSQNITIGCSNMELQDALYGIQGLNIVNVTTPDIRVNTETVTYSYTLFFPQDQSWPFDVNNIHLYASQTPIYAYGVMNPLVYMYISNASLISIEINALNSPKMVVYEQLNITLTDIASLTNTTTVSNSSTLVKYHIPIYVLPVNDHPIVNATGNDYFRIKEDSSLHIQGISISAEQDILKRKDIILQLDIYSSHINITFPKLISSIISQISDVNTISMSGTVIELSSVLGEIYLIPAPNYFGRATISFTLYMPDKTSTISTIAIDIDPIIEDITLNLASSSSLVVVRNSSSLLPGLHMYDPDDIYGTNEINLNMGCKYGIFLIPTLQYVDGVIFLPVSWTNSSIFSFDGRVNEANIILKYLQYASINGTNANDEINIKVRREFSSLYAATLVIPVRVLDTRNYSFVPLIVPSSLVTISEDTSWDIGSFIGFDLPLHVHLFLVDVLLNCEYGSLYMQDGANGNGLASSGSTLHLLGPVNDVRAALSTVTYIPPLNFHGSVKFVFSVVKDPTGSIPGPSLAEFYLYIDSVYDPPTISYNVNSVINGGSSISSPLPLDAFEIVTLEEELLIIETFVSHGTLSLQLSTDLRAQVYINDFRVNANSTTSENYIGFASESRLVNDILRLITFHPQAAFVGTVKVSVSVRSLNVTGTAALLATKTVEFQARAPSTVQLNCISSMRLLEDAKVSFASLCNTSSFVSASDRTGEVFLVLSAPHGKMSIVDSGDSRGTGYFAHSIVNATSIRVYTRLLYLRDILANILYTSNRLFNGNTSVSINLLVNSTSSGLLYHTVKTIKTNIIPVNNIPLITSNISTIDSSLLLTILSNTSLIVDFWHVMDEDLIETQYGWLDVYITANIGDVRLTKSDYRALEVLVRDSGKETGDVYFMTTDVNANKVLRYGLISYFPVVSNVDYIDNITLKVCDNGFTGVDISSTNCSSSTISVYVKYIPIFPQIIPQSIIHGIEDTELSLGNAIIIDTGTFPLNTSVHMELSTSSGYLLVDTTHSFARSIAVNATIQELRRVLNTTIFKPFQFKNLEMYVSATLTGQGFQSSARVSIFLTPVENMPSVDIRQSTFTLNSSQILRLSALQMYVSDPDDNDGINRIAKLLNISTNCGYFTVDELYLSSKLKGSRLTKKYDENIYVSGSNYTLGYGRVLFNGLANDINTALSAIILYPLADFTGQCAIHVYFSKVESLNNYSVTKQVSGQIVAITSLSLECVSDLVLAEATGVVGTELNLAMHDDIMNLKGRYNLKISSSVVDLPSVYILRMLFPLPTVLEPSVVVEFSSDGSSVNIQGLKDSVLSTVNKLNFSPPLHFHGTFNVHVSLTNANNATVNTMIPIIYFAVNHPPVLNMTTNTIDLDIIPTLDTLFSVTDPDISFLVETKSSLLRTQLSQCCFLSLNISCEGCYFTSGVSTTDSVYMMGTPDQLLGILKQISISPINSNKNATLSFLIDDLQSFGSGHNYILQHSEQIQFLTASRPPYIDIPSTATLYDIKEYSLQELANKYIQLRNFGNIGQMKLTVSSLEGGSLQLSFTSTPLFQQLTNHSVVLFGSVLQLNAYLNGLLYFPVSGKLVDIISISAINVNSNDLIVQSNLTLFIRAFAHDITLHLNQSHFYGQENSIFLLSNIVINDNNSMMDERQQEQYSSFDDTLYTAEVNTYYGGSLEVQLISTSAIYVNIEQVITISSLNINDTVSSGNFSLSADLSDFGLGMRISPIIQYNAIAMKWSHLEDEFYGTSYDINESMESKITSLLSPLLDIFDIQVTVMKQVTAGSISWTVTLVNAPFNTPSFVVTRNKVYSASGILCACTAVESEPGNHLGGSFHLQLGVENTSTLSHDATAEDVANALESLSTVQAVCVSRLGPGRVGNYSWLVTFFSLTASSVSNVTQLSVLPSLTGDVSVNTFDGLTPKILSPQSSVTTIVDGSGTTRVYKIATVTKLADAVYTILFTPHTLTSDDYFYLSVNYGTQTSVIGPIYAHTVPMISNEVPGPYPPHDQLEGTKVGQSMQSLLLSISFFSNIATNVHVMYDTTSHIWTVTFLQSSFQYLTILGTTDSQGMVHDSRTNITQIEYTNFVIGTTFSLSYGGHRTSILPYNCTSDEMRNALMNLTTIHDPVYNIGSVDVGRRGPDRHAAYVWYVAFIQESDAYPNNQLIASIISGQGIDTNIAVTLLRDLPDRSNAGLYLNKGGYSARGIRNLATQSLFIPEALITFESKSLTALYSTLANIAFLPPTNWEGELKLLFRVGDSAAMMNVAVANSTVTFRSVNQPPVFHLKDLPLQNNVSVAVDEDIASHIQFIQIFDVDAGTGELSLNITARRGTLAVGSTFAFSSTLSLNGNIIELNVQLRSLLYMSCSNCNGNDLLTLSLSDNGNTGFISSTGSTSVVTGAVKIQINPYNDPPMIDVTNTSTYSRLYDNESSWETGLFNYLSNEQIRLSDLFSVSDVDFDPANIFYDHIGSSVDPYALQSMAFAGYSVDLNISVSYGYIIAGSMESLQVIEGDIFHGSSVITLRGNPYDIQKQLFSLIYIPRLDWFGIELMELSLDDRGSIGLGVSIVNQRKILLDIQSIPFAPTIQAPQITVFKTYEDSIGVIGRDLGLPDSNKFLMSVESFQISDRNDPIIPYSHRMIIAKNTREFSLYGPIFSNETYSNATRYNVYAFTYGGNVSSTNQTFSLHIQVYHGTITLSEVSPNIVFIHGSGFQDDNFTFSGTLFDVNKALESMEYRPDTNWNSLHQATTTGMGSGIFGIPAAVSDFEHIDIKVTDNTGLSSESSIPIYVAPVNDAPVLSVGELTIQDSLLATGDQVSRVRSAVKPLDCIMNIACPLLDIIIRDIDVQESSNGSILITLQATNGSFYVDPSVNPTHPILQKYLKRNGLIVDMEIPASNIEITLKGIYYRSNNDYVGSDSIFLSVSDLGNTGKSFSCPGSADPAPSLHCDLTDSVTIPVTIKERDSVPLIIVPSSALDAIEQSVLLIKGVSLSSHRLQYIVPPHRSLLQATNTYSLASQFVRTIESKVLYYVRLIADSGTISLPRGTAHVQYYVGNGENDPVIEFTATLLVATSVLSDIRYVPAFPDTSLPDHIDTITISLRDTETNLQAIDQYIKIRTTPKFHRPVLHVMGEVFSHRNHTIPDIPTLDYITPISIQEDERISLEAVYISTYRVSSATYKLTLSASNGSVISSDSILRQVFRPYDGKIQVYGDIEYLNEVLRSLFYLPHQYYYGTDMINVQVCDTSSLQFLSDSTGVTCIVLCDERRIPVNTSPVNNAPVWTVFTSSASIPQDSSVAVGSYFTVGDVDSEQLLITVQVNIGTVSLQQLPHGLSILRGTGEMDIAITFSALRVSMQNVFDMLIYSPPLGWNSFDQNAVVTFKLYAEDFDSPRLSASASFTLLVERGIQRNPFFRLPGAMYRQTPCNSQALPQVDMSYPEDTICKVVLSIVPYDVLQNAKTVISNISLYYLDNLPVHNAVFELLIQAEYGQISLPQAILLGLRADIDSRGVLSTIGTVEQLNLAVQQLVYVSNASYAYTDNLEFSLRNVAYKEFLSWTNVTLPIQINRQEFLPLILASTHSIAVLEDHVVGISGLKLTFTDVSGEDFYDADYVERQSNAVEVHFTSAHGYLLLATRGLNVTLTPTNTSELDSMYYNNVLRYRDPFMSKNLWLSSFTIRGSIAQVNIALSSALYRPGLNWNSALGRGTELDTLNFTVAFMPSATNNFSNNAMTSIITAMVFAANDAPVISTLGDYYSSILVEDMLSFQVIGTNPLFVEMNGAVEIQNTSVRDVDFIHDEYLTVTLTAENGVVSVNNILAASLLSLSRPLLPLGLYFIVGTGSNDVTMEFRAPLSIVNEALSTITFSPNLNFYGYGGKLTLTVEDVGQTGAGGRRTDIRVWTIVTLQKNIVPVIRVPSATGGPALFATNEGAFVRLTGARSNLVVQQGSRNAGFELYAYYEPSVYSGTAFGAGDLDFNSKQYFDIYPGSSSSHPSYFVSYQNSIYFQADDGVHGMELWRVERYDHISKQTRDYYPFLFSDLYPGSLGSNPAHMTVHNGYLYFGSSGIDTSWMIVYAHRDSCGAFRQSSTDSRVHFAVAQNNSWDSTKLYDCPVGFRWASTDEGSGLFPSTVSPANPSQAAIPKVYFDECGWSGYSWGGVTRRKFRFSDSYSTGAFKDAGFPDSYRPDLADFTTNQFAGIVCVVNNYLGILAPTANNELWRTDGTIENTERVDDVNPGSIGSYPAGLTSFSGYLYYSATTDIDGRELWRSVADGLHKPNIISYGTSIGIYPEKGDSNPAYLVATPNYLFFTATSPTTGRELWTIKAADSSVSVLDIVPGTASSSPTNIVTCGSVSFVLFAATTAATGTELWSSDGTALNTFLVKDICLGTGSSSPSYLTCFKGLVYFQADDCINGPELWVTDGLLNGNTHMLRDIRPGSGGSSPNYFSIFHSQLDQQDYLMFTATNGLYTNAETALDGYGGSQIWRTDGTSSGTTRALMQTENDLYPDRFQMDIAFPQSLISYDGILLIPGSRDSNTGGSASSSGSSSSSSSVSNGEQVFSFSQAVVITDLDTPPDGYMTLTITAGKGLVLLNYNASTSSFPAQLNILLADPSTVQSLLIFNILFTLGHSITIVTSGSNVISALANATLANITYDCIFLYGQLEPSPLDAFGTTRIIRSSGNLITIIGYSTDPSIGPSLLDAGVNQYVVEPTLTGTSSDRSNFQLFLNKIIEFFHPSSSELNVLSVIYPDIPQNITLLANNILAKSITLNGTITILNTIVGSLYYYAPAGVYGNDVVNFFVTDNPQPAVCLASLLLSPIASNLSSFPLPTICDSTTHNTVQATLPVYVTSINHPPVINTTAASFTSLVGVDTIIPTVTISDPDFSKVTSVATDAYGNPQFPVMSAMITALYGVISLPNIDGLSLTMGQGFLDSVSAVNGPLSNINTALSTLLYQCRSTDFCSQLGKDTLTFYANDNGFTGSGGALSFTLVLNVTISTT